MVVPHKREKNKTKEADDVRTFSAPPSTDRDTHSSPDNSTPDNTSPDDSAPDREKRGQVNLAMEPDESVPMTTVKTTVTIERQENDDCYIAETTHL